MTPLPLLHPAGACGDCGLCCTEIGTPPGFAAFFPRSGGISDADRASDDYGHLMSAPVAARIELLHYYAAVDRGETEDRSAYAVPCLWYDPVAKACRHYEHRPQVCREFRPGSCACRRWRAGGGLCDQPPPDDEEDE